MDKWYSWGGLVGAIAGVAIGNLANLESWIRFAVIIICGLAGALIQNKLKN